MTRKFSSSTPTSALATCALASCAVAALQSMRLTTSKEARSLWLPHAYDLILLDARGHFTGDALDFYLEIKHASPNQRVIFLVGPPTYLSLTWPTEVMPTEKEPQQWAETVKRFVTAA